MKRIHGFKDQALGHAFTLIMIAILPLAGCQMDHGRTASLNASTPVSTQNQGREGVTNLQQRELSSGQNQSQQSQPVNECQSELRALAKINPQEYAERKAAFDSLLNNAAVYTSVRGQVNNNTQDAVDALYKYKVQQICSEIKYSVMRGLMRRGESLK
ncbi:hypothetical protein TUM12370_27960 [Salmonella enterica subsp. enterica serovar Choleraesuis]|nr:hypothetical protein TUM12370_27960 [Salmonella enterica subsp. enterica serovar Choleraesuis]